MYGAFYQHFGPFINFFFPYVTAKVFRLLAFLISVLMHVLCGFFIAIPLSHHEEPFMAYLVCKTCFCESHRTKPLPSVCLVQLQCLELCRLSFNCLYVVKTLQISV